MPLIKIKAKPYAGSIADTVLVLFSAAFLFSYFPLELVFDHSTPTGGDMPGHNYLASYLQRLLQQGELFGWAPGWWAGFPMFQFYMIIPYFMMAALGFVIPLQIAFKLVCAGSIIMLPIAAYFGMKWAGSKRPVPAFAAVLMIPYLFVKTHTIWGMNIYSMLAGEIANSVSLSFMLLCWGLFHKSIREQRVSIWCAILLTLTIMTHPTTSIFVLSSSIWALVYLKKGNAKKWLLICLQTFGLSFLLVAFWAIPLVTKLEYTVGFGEDWPVSLISSFPKYAWIFAFGAIVGMISGIKERQPHVGYLTFGLVISGILFQFGYHFNLVNIRFWGLVYLMLILLASEGFGFLSRKLEGHYLVPFIPLVIGCYFFSPDKTIADDWVRWNFKGIESKAGWRAYAKIVKTIGNTRGRLAYDLHDENSASFGSVRAFEAIPYFTEKHLIEGGILQSGLTSLFTRHLQGEFSPTTAGFPRLTRAGKYDLENAIRHLELYNVKHLVARHKELKEDLESSNEWRHVIDAGPFHAVYELTTHDARYVYIPPNYPIPVHSEKWKMLAVDWFG